MFSPHTEIQEKKIKNKEMYSIMSLLGRPKLQCEPFISVMKQHELFRIRILIRATKVRKSNFEGPPLHIRKFLKESCSATGISANF
jgi:hypothetical protein